MASTIDINLETQEIVSNIQAIDKFVCHLQMSDKALNISERKTNLNNKKKPTLLFSVDKRSGIITFFCLNHKEHRRKQTNRQFNHIYCCQIVAIDYVDFAAVVMLMILTFFACQHKTHKCQHSSNNHR